MCDKCGCSEPNPLEPPKIQIGTGEIRRIEIQRGVLDKNKKIAEENRRIFREKKLVVLNLISSPGTGKTTLLERTCRDWKDRGNFCVIEGDQHTDRDARRIEEAGTPVVQINTPDSCHLDALLVQNALSKLNLHQKKLLFIENVGNLICPATFDLGEHHRVVLLSVPEGSDKPLKYPTVFRMAQVMVITKTDLIPYVDFDLDQCRKWAREVNPHLRMIETSTKEEKGMDQWYSWLEEIIGSLPPS